MFTGPSFSTPRARRCIETVQADLALTGIAASNNARTQEPESLEGHKTSNSSWCLLPPRRQQHHTSADEEADARLGTLRDIELPPRLLFDDNQSTCSWDNLCRFGWIGAVLAHPFESSSYYCFGRHDKNRQWIPDEQVELQYRRIMWDTHDLGTLTTFLWVLSCIAVVGTSVFAPLTVSVSGLNDVTIWDDMHFCILFAISAGGAFTLPALAYAVTYHPDVFTTFLFHDHHTVVSRDEAKKSLTFLSTVQFMIAGTLWLVLASAWFTAFHSISSVAYDQVKTGERSIAQYGSVWYVAALIYMVALVYLPERMALEFNSGLVITVWFPIATCVAQSLTMDTFGTRHEGAAWFPFIGMIASQSSDLTAYSVFSLGFALMRVKMEHTRHGLRRKDFLLLAATKIHLDRYFEMSFVHRSMSSLVMLAKDLANNQKPVALKFMRERTPFIREIKSRVEVGTDNDCVVGLYGFHTPEGEGLSLTEEHELSSLKAAQKEMVQQLEQSRKVGATTAFERDWPYVLVMEQESQSLFHRLVSQRIAGHDKIAVLNIFAQVVRQTKQLQEQGLLHFDIKPRNILFRSNDVTASEVVLCDLDASMHMGVVRSSAEKEPYSSAYYAPEVARWVDSGKTHDLVASEKIDVWSIGVLLFELCAGQHLFSQDLSDDSTVVDIDRTRLCVWNTISDEELEPVRTIFGPEAKDLVRWCLKGRPDERPTLNQILQHAFIHPNGQRDQDGYALPRMPMHYHGFQSHCQADASGTVNALFFQYKGVGLHNWIDMRQQKLNLQSMKEDIRNSDVFILFLSEHVLGQWFCQQEMLEAIKEKKRRGMRIQLIIEEESRFSPFDIASWESKDGNDSDVAVERLQREYQEIQKEIQQQRQALANAGQVDEEDNEDRTYVRLKELRLRRQNNITEQKTRTTGCTMTRQVGGGFVEVPLSICEMIREHLPDAVTYRRRDYEADAMMKELCRRNDLHLPTRNKECREESDMADLHKPVGSFNKVWTGLLRVMIIAKSATVGQDIENELTRMTAGHIQFTRAADSVHAVDKVLLILTSGVLESPTLDVLEEALLMDEGTNRDRLSCVFIEELGWTFGCQEQKSASEAVQTALVNHEAIRYRAKSEGRCKHEFGTMCTKLLEVLRKETLTSGLSRTHSVR